MYRSLVLRLISPLDKYSRPNSNSNTYTNTNTNIDTALVCARSRGILGALKVAMSI